MTDLRKTPLRRLLLLSALMGGASLVEDTATGNPLTFTTDLAKPLVSLEVPFTPIQEGSGDPSPSNIRPIVPWNGLTVYHSGADTSEYTETDISFPSPVYGGTLDAVSGVLTVEWVLISKKWSEWDVDEVLTNVTRKTITLPKQQDMYVQRGEGNSKVNVTNVYLNSNSSDTVHYYINQRGNVLYAFLPNDFDGETVVQFSAKLITPYDIQLTPAQITALIGNNTIWSDADGSMTAVYLKKA